MRIPLVVLLALAACSDKTPPKVDVPPPATTPDDAGVGSAYIVSGVETTAIQPGDDTDSRAPAQPSQPELTGQAD